MDNLFSTNTSCNAPINIITNNVSVASCDNFCDYSFNYPVSSIKITNNANYLSISYDNGSTAPVVYGENKYTVEEIRIYSSACNSYNGVKPPAEILIIHTPVVKGNPLIVAIPVTVSNNAGSPGSLMIKSILNYGLKLIQEKDAATTISNIKNFSLNMFVPKRIGFYKYTGSNFLDSGCSSSSISNTDVICFLPSDAKIHISNDLLTSLTNTISQNTIIAQPLSSSQKLFKNDKGATNITTDSTSDVEMDCRPYDDTGDTVEQVDYVEDIDPHPVNAQDIFKSPWFQVIAGSISFLLIICILNFIFGIFQKNSEISDVAAAAAAGKGISFSFFGKK